MNPIAAAYAWWEGIPAPIREPIRSATVSASFTVQTAFWMLLGAAAQDGHCTSPADFAGYAWTHSWGCLIAVLLPTAYRAKQGFDAATKTVSTDASFSTPQPPPPQRIASVEPTIDTPPQKGT